MRRIIVLSILALLSSCTIFMKNKQVVRPQVTLKVYDSETKKPLEDVVLTIKDSTKGTSNTSGRIVVERKKDYLGNNHQIALRSDKDSKFNFTLLDKNFGIPKKAGEKQHLLDYVKEKLELYTAAVQNKNTEERHLVAYYDYLDFNNEKVLINKYIHWSATNKTGHSPRIDKNRTIKDA